VTATGFRRLDEAFNAAVELDGERRAAFISEFEATDPELARRLRAMLEAESSGEDPLRASVQRAAADLEDAPPASIGPFEVIRRLGQGGMGSVYLCRRSDGEFEQLLAVKRLAGAGGGLVGERLKLERRVLAALRHPHIAQFVDGGEDADGTPWVAMEYVEGSRIDHHAADGNLNRRARVKLFLQLADAVQYAHRNLVVHRDLKPDNVMVDAHGKVKLLDFGIAKLLDDAPADTQAAPTVAGAMTPHYASPEQVRGEPVSQASDIYSLGVLLYELLARERPYRIETTRPSEVERIVCEVEPAPPSRLFGPRDASARDLDAIVLKALHKAPERRYASAAQLGEDLERWLEGRPVQARPDSAAYRLSTFARRHPIGVASSALLLLLLAGFGGAMAWQAALLAQERDLATREATVAQETADFLIELFGASDPRVTNPADVRARDLLEVAAERLPEALASDPLARARLMHTIGLAFSNMGEDARGTALLTQALALRERYAGADSAEVADSLNRLGNIHRQFGRLEQAETMLVRALEWRRQHLPVDDDLADSHNNVGLLQIDLGHYAEAEHTLRQAIALHREAGGDDTTLAASPLHNLALALRNLDRLEEAREAASESLALKRRAGTPAASTANTMAALANIERQLGRLDEALAHSSESLALRREAYGSDSPMIATGLVTHAHALAALGNDAEARAHFEEALALHAASGQGESAAAANSLLGYGRFLLARGETDAALAHLERAHAIVIDHYPSGSPALARYAEALKEAQAAGLKD
jgi:eukaryotic-like serine/threonine-protein kinase